MQQDLTQTLLASGKFTLATDEEIDQIMSDPWTWCRPMAARTEVQTEQEPRYSSSTVDSNKAAPD